MPAPKHTAPKDPTPVAAVRHDDRRVNIPTVDGQDFVADEVAAPVTTRWPRQTELDPQLVWRGKDAQADVLEVTTPPIFIQEKIDPRALVENLRRTAQRPEGEPEATLFESFDDLGPFESVEYYRHRSKWANRMILGDSLAVMASLAERENLRGQVQAIYIDPPYGIKFGSNWQPRVDKRDVKDGNLADIARETEQIKAFRDTWEDGIHSYLTYLSDRLLVARGLLTQSGSIFVQIGEENAHLVRSLLDEVFGVENFVSQIAFAKSGATDSDVIARTSDYIIWFAQDRTQMKVRRLWSPRVERGESTFTWLELADGTSRRMTSEERSEPQRRPVGSRAFRAADISSQGASAKAPEAVHFAGRQFLPSPGRHWSAPTVRRAIAAGRVVAQKTVLAYKRFEDDFPLAPLTHIWSDTVLGTFSEKHYVVQTAFRPIERCLLMVTDPGDLVLDPTCGSGTTAYVAEQWGRRWITIDTSRVAITIARQRVMAARFPYYLLADSAEGAAKERSLGTPADAITTAHGDDIRQGFVYKRVPHVTLKSIANNPEIREGMTRAEIDAAIARHAETETLYDQPYENPKKVRVAGTFTVESLSPHRSASFDAAFPADAAAPRVTDVAAEDVSPTSSYEETIFDNLRTAGVQNGRRKERLLLTSVDPYPGRFVQAVAAATTEANLEAARAVSSTAEPATQQVAVALGPEYGTVDARMVKAAAREALAMPGVEMLLVLGYAFEANALDAVEEAQREGFANVAAEHRLGRLPVLLVRMNADLAMGDELLKNSSAANLFTVFGEPDIDVRVTDEGVLVEIRGIDVYDPTTGDVRSNSADGIAL
ncbi:site-specific DNA-methyltransferase [Cellulomonas marina]|uniref:Adenine-specific DNA-methyltransferase n=1 Tax=Cellulomonas marina TaxID=988821 RepID=A0A1I0X7R9_9CELL|nr:site-specific DNA-methyltransferase [Cellulomonas marina]GIG29498.1 DNA methylase [Cellulomonas marina]SFA97069.1 adenine-specific DNA-methyltransferase [Cellulomonas marina]